MNESNTTAMFHVALDATGKLQPMVAPGARKKAVFSRVQYLIVTADTHVAISSAKCEEH